MKITITQKVEKDVEYLHVMADSRYWEDSKINGEDALEDGSNTPCKDGSTWKPVIKLSNGQIVNWTKGVTADIHYKVCDAGVYKLVDDMGNMVKSIDGYVPTIMCPNGNGYGDYIIMTVDENGFIKDFKANLDEFLEEDED